MIIWIIIAFIGIVCVLIKSRDADDIFGVSFLCLFIGGFISLMIGEWTTPYKVLVNTQTIVPPHESLLQITHNPGTISFYVQNGDSVESREIEIEHTVIVEGPPQLKTYEYQSSLKYWAFRFGQPLEYVVSVPNPSIIQKN